MTMAMVVYPEQQFEVTPTASAMHDEGDDLVLCEKLSRGYHQTDLSQVSTYAE